MTPSAPTVTIGREKPAADVAIAGPGANTVSRKHATISKGSTPGTYTLTDLGSSNGTFAYVDGQWVPVTKARVDRNTRVRFGKLCTTIAEIVDTYNKGVTNTIYRDPITGEIINNSL